MNSVAAVDGSNVDNVFKIWRSTFDPSSATGLKDHVLILQTVFAISGETLENGRRFENLSWRLWNKEALCTGEEAVASSRRPSVVAAPAIPEEKVEETNYASSVESVPSPLEPDVNRPQGIAIRPALSRRHSSDRKDKQPSPAQLVRLMDKVASQDPDVRSWGRKYPSPSSEYKHVVTDLLPASPSLADSTCSTDSNCTMESESGRVIRGFSLGKTSTVATSFSTQASFDRHEIVEKPKAKGMFMVGPGSYDSSSSDSYSSSPSLITRFRKQTSFNEEVATRQYHDSDDDVLSESAIEDEDDSDWDSVTDSAGSSYDNRQMFARQSETRLPSNRSLLSTLLTEPVTKARLQHRREGPSLPHSPRDGYSRMKSHPIADLPSALSPSTTRKQMIATELSDSLRRNLLWERAQKTKTTAAVLKRRNTAQDFAVYQKVDAQVPYTDNTKNISWNSYHDQAFLDYNAVGW